MRTSARNQWAGKVVSVHLGAVTAEVQVALDGGTEVVATMTLDSAQRLGLQSGRDVQVWVKASMVVLALDFDGYLISARNQCLGQVVEIRSGLVTTEVTLQLSQGDTVTSVMTRESAETLGLVVGQSAMALFTTGAVMVATRR